MKKEYRISVDCDLAKNFEIALNLNNDNETEVINSMLKAYVARAFSNVVAMYDINSDPSFDNGEYYGKALGKIS